MAMIGRKGFTYILAASLIIVILIAVFLAYKSYSLQEKEKLYQARIRAMNDFVKSFNSDVHRATYISAFRSMIALEDSVTSSGAFLSSINASFRETFFYGTINGTEVQIMGNSSFEDYLSRLNQLANSVGIIIAANITNISISQPSPWSMDIVVSADINITDSRRLASWEFHEDYLTTIPIHDLRDPLYGVYTDNKIPNTIRTFNESYFVSADNDTTNLQWHINESFYVASTESPSFIMRFEGRTSADPNGIESIVNIRKLSDQDIQVFTDRVKVDYIYFNNINISKACSFQDVPAEYYLVLPQDRLDEYDVDGLGYSTTCP